jgi:hypothetical protein
MNNDENVTISFNTGAYSISISRNLAVPSSPLGFPMGRATQDARNTQHAGTGMLDRCLERRTCSTTCS